MKIKHVIMTLGLAAVLGLGVGVGLKAGQVKEARAGTVWYYRGSDTNKTTDWDHGSDSYTIEDGGDTIHWTFVVGEEFKFYDKKDAWSGDTYGINNIYGSASSLFYKKGGDKDNLAYRGEANGTFDLTLSGGNLYCDYRDDDAVFYYFGSDATKAGSAWANYTTKPMTLNGASAQITLAVDEEFKLRSKYETSTGNSAIGITNVSGKKWSDDDSTNYAYYKCFSGTDNIKVRNAGTYNVSVTCSERTLSIELSYVGAESANISVLDLHNSRLHVTRHAHVYNATLATDFPGLEPASTNGRIYTFSYWNVMTKVIFTNDGSNQTAEQTIQAGKCFVLYEDWSGEWISLEAAQFIDGYMLFNSYSESQNTDPGKSENCDARWDAAVAAYNALSSNAVRKDVLSIDVVAGRLGEWAAAHGKALDLENGAQVSLPSNNLELTPVADSNNTLTIAIVAVSAISLLAVGGFFFIRKRKEER